jgi:hypothetical protein
MYVHLSCITGEMSPTGEGSISCGYLIYMYEGGIVGKKGGLSIEHLSRYNCSSSLDKHKENKLIKKKPVQNYYIYIYIFYSHTQFCK